MLGRFLEYSVATMDIQESLDFYRRLGFSQTAVGEAWSHPYAVVTDGRICIGLHQMQIATPTLTFVKPDLLKFLSEAEQADLQLEYRHLGNHIFNQIGFLDPDGHVIRMIEARSFSPSARKSTDFSTCGYFEEIALPCANLETGKRFWESSGFVGMDDLDARLPHVSCTSDYIDIGIYDAKYLRQSALIFACADLPIMLEAAKTAGLEPSGNIPAALSRKSNALFLAPEGTQILISAEIP